MTVALPHAHLRPASPLQQVPFSSASFSLSDTVTDSRANQSAPPSASVCAYSAPDWSLGAWPAIAEPPPRLEAETDETSG
uniref:Uncharacterized protein n=1 Tax=Knipowitschia caucasica TaxID=637954 RepID=A0AAV2J6P3_KNICA